MKPLEFTVLLKLYCNVNVVPNLVSYSASEQRNSGIHTKYIWKSQRGGGLKVWSSSGTFFNFLIIIVDPHFSLKPLFFLQIKEQNEFQEVGEGGRVNDNVLRKYIRRTIVFYCSTADISYLYILLIFRILHSEI